MAPRVGNAGSGVVPLDESIKLGMLVMQSCRLSAMQTQDETRDGTRSACVCLARSLQECSNTCYFAAVISTKGLAWLQRR